MYAHLVELLWPMTWSKASLIWNNIPWGGGVDLDHVVELVWDAQG